MEETVVKNGKELCCGYTTGTCAAAAASAAAEILLSGNPVHQVKVLLPGGKEAVLPVEETRRYQDSVFCSVIKHAGDDPDVTDGMAIGALVSLHNGKDILLTGGQGVGTVTGPGLQVPPGEAAINPVPRRMIQTNVAAVCAAHQRSEGMRVVISAENGEEIAKKTFNPRLGIVGGISILGTTGIVEPMSERALVETIHVLIDKARVRDPKKIAIAPGNYGRDYCLKNLGFDLEDSVKFSNFVGETLDYLVYRGFEKVLLVGHVGKLAKLAAGVMNTHSSYADCRMEVLAVHSVLQGAEAGIVKEIMDCRTTDEAISLLDSKGLTDRVMQSVMEKALEHIHYRTHGALDVEMILFTTGDRMLARTEGAEKLAREIGRMTPAAD